MKKVNTLPSIDDYLPEKKTVTQPPQKTTVSKESKSYFSKFFSNMSKGSAANLKAASQNEKPSPKDNSSQQKNNAPKDDDTPKAKTP